MPIRRHQAEQTRAALQSRRVDSRSTPGLVPSLQDLLRYGNATRSAAVSVP